MLPSLFISHGAPTLPLDDCPARTFISGLGKTLPKPKAILAVSAHWDTETPAVNRVSVNDTIHDFYGFPDALYRLRYPAPGSAELAQRAISALQHAGFPTQADNDRGLDHGAWVPLLLMYPEQISRLYSSVSKAASVRHITFSLGRPSAVYAMTASFSARAASPTICACWTGPVLMHRKHPGSATFPSGFMPL